MNMNKGTNCVSCGRNSLRKFAIDFDGRISIPIVECTGCELAWQWPLLPSEETGTKLFDQLYGEEGGCESKEYFTDDNRRTVASLEMDFVESLGKPAHQRILDVGAGIGTFVEEAQARGWNATGVEPSNTAVIRAKSRGITVIHGTAASLPAGEFFDVVTAWDVIEHILEPADFISELSNRLLASGWLVLETGNYQSIARIKLGKEWWLWNPDHRWYFSPAYLESILRACGFGNFIFSKRTLRPGAVDSIHYPLWWYYSKRILKRPHKITAEISDFSKVQTALKKWSLASIPIFAVAAQKM
jgi:SAM-dependent methyltransferase